MFFYEGLICPHCEKPFEATDDIVACPVCGAPHHRDCWNANGDCACKADHGTDNQWSRETAKTASDDTADKSDTVPCPNCGFQNSPYAEICSHCGRPVSPQEWHSPHTQQVPPPPPGFNEYSPFHKTEQIYGGVSPTTLIEGESAKDLAAIVKFNPHYYLPRFERMAVSGGKVSWNWAAFFLPSYWLLYRKQYAAAGVAILFELLQNVVLNWLLLTFFPSATSLTAYAEFSQEVTHILMTNPKALMASALMMLVMLAGGCVHLAVGLFGNRLYMKSCLRSIRKTREHYPEGYHAQLALIGGTSLILAMIGYFAVPYIVSFLLMLIM